MICSRGRKITPTDLGSHEKNKNKKSSGTLWRPTILGPELGPWPRYFDPWLTTVSYVPHLSRKALCILKDSTCLERRQDGFLRRAHECCPVGITKLWLSQRNTFGLGYLSPSNTWLLINYFRGANCRNRRKCDVAQRLANEPEQSKGIWEHVIWSHLWEHMDFQEPSHHPLDLNRQSGKLATYFRLPEIESICCCWAIPAHLVA